MRAKQAPWVLLCSNVTLLQSIQDLVRRVFIKAGEQNRFFFLKKSLSLIHAFYIFSHGSEASSVI